MSLRNSLIILLSVLGLFSAAFAGNGQPAPGENAAYTSTPSTPSASAPDQGAYFAPFMRFDAAAGNLDVTFGIEQGARITLHAYDTQGKLLGILMDRNQGAGFHHLSLFSNHLQGYKGRVIFRLRAGQSVLAETRV